jgi:hypothetical protein
MDCRITFLSIYIGFTVCVVCRSLSFTADYGKRVVLGDLLLHVVFELLFSFCTVRDRPGTKTEQ